MGKLTCTSRTEEKRVYCQGVSTLSTVPGSIIHVRKVSCESGWDKTGTVPNCGTACCEPRSRDRPDALRRTADECRTLRKGTPALL